MESETKKWSPGNTQFIAEIKTTVSADETECKLAVSCDVADMRWG